MQTPTGGYVTSGIGFIGSAFFLFAAVMLWSGWDIDLDSKTGKLSITRFGEGN